MTLSKRWIGLGAAALCGVFAPTTAAWSYPTELSSGIFRPAAENKPWAVYAYDPNTRTWTEMSDVSWREVASEGHSSYVFEATATTATAVSTFRVIFDVLGAPFEVFMTPDVIRRLAAGESTSLRINLF